MEKDQEWDEGLGYVLFAIRDARNDSLAFSPFELVFGHDVRSPLRVLFEGLLEEGQNSESAITHVTKFTEKLKAMHDFAKINLATKQTETKARFDKKSKTRSFQIGDRVIVFLPVPKQPFEERFCGPYTIKNKLSNNNYVIETPDRRKNEMAVHVNLIKKYVTRRDENENKAVGSVNANYENEKTEPLNSDHNEPELDHDLEIEPRLKNSELLKKMGNGGQK
jgi:hypothetical protein